MADYYGFQQEWLPGNPLNANLQGYSTFLTGNMPASYALASIRQTGFDPNLINYLGATQNPNRSAAAWERVMRENQQAQTAQDTQDATQTQGSSPSQQFSYWWYRAQGYSQEEAEKLAGIYQANQTVRETVAANEVAKANESFCARFGESGIARSICDTSVDAGKRIGVSAIGVLLIALGIWSLR